MWPIRPRRSASLPCDPPCGSPDTTSTATTTTTTMPPECTTSADCGVLRCCGQFGRCCTWGQSCLEGGPAFPNSDLYCSYFDPNAPDSPIPDVCGGPQPSVSDDGFTPFP